MTGAANKRPAIYGLLRAGWGPAAIVKELGVARTSVYRAKKALEAGQGPDVQPRSGRPRTATKRRASAAILRKVRKDPKRPLRQIAAELQTTHTAVNSVVKEAGFRSLRRVKIPLLSARHREMRLDHCTKLINNLKSGAAGRIVFFSDEKTFTVEPYVNRQNDRWVQLGGPQAAAEAGDQAANCYVMTTKHPAAAMLLGVVASTGEMGPPIWYPQGYRLCAEAYVKALREKIVPWMRQVAAEHGRGGCPAKFVYQQDSAPAHKAKITLDFLREEGIDFWGPDMWPPNSPDLAPLDYGVWPYIAAKACKTRADSAPVLKCRVNAAWRHTEPSKIRSICAHFRARLEKCVEVQGSNFNQ